MGKIRHIQIINKTSYLFILNIFLFLVGCSTTYKVTNYSSEEEFYKDFNNSAYNREDLKITLSNDSSFVSIGAIIRNDTIFYNDTRILSYNSWIPMKEINKASYNNHLQGAIPGLFIGPVAGAILGSTGWIIKPKMGGNAPFLFDRSKATVLGSLLGLGVGTMVGIILGYTHYFIFSP